jgi:hypothetical protein
MEVYNNFVYFIFSTTVESNRKRERTSPLQMGKEGTELDVI